VDKVSGRSNSIGEPIEICRSWRLIAGMWFGLHYAIGMAAIALSAAVALKPFAVRDASPLYTQLSWCSALAAGLVTLLQALPKAQRAMMARDGLAREITLYLDDPEYPLTHVLDAVDRGQAIIQQRSIPTVIQGKAKRSKRVSVRAQVRDKAVKAVLRKESGGTAPKRD
jgi:hypothetical protein